MLEADLGLARQETRRYAKRQTAWFSNSTPVFREAECLQFLGGML